MDDAHKELVKRLRSEEWATVEREQTRNAAADALEAMAGEVEAYESARVTWAESMRAWINRATVAERERDRLKAAITEALNNAQDRLDYDCKCKDCTDTLAPVEDVLRKALGGDA